MAVLVVWQLPCGNWTRGRNGHPQESQARGEVGPIATRHLSLLKSLSVIIDQSPQSNVIDGHEIEQTQGLQCWQSTKDI